MTDNNIFNLIKGGFKFIGLTIIDPRRSLSQLADDENQVFYGWFTFLLSLVIFAPILILAAIYLRPTGWLPLFIKGIPEDMIYVYFCATSPVLVILDLVVLASMEMIKIFCPSKDSLPFKSTFSTTMISISMIIYLDIITESIAIVYFFVTGASFFPEILKIVMFFLCGIMFAWMIALFSISISVTKKISWGKSVTFGVIVTLIYWILLTFWIF